MLRCNYLFHFLNKFAQALTEAQGRLESLEIQLPEDLVQPTATIEAIERFLKACPSLGALALRLLDHGLIEKSCFLPHAATLRSLVLDTTGPSWMPTYHSVPDMTVLLAACRKLKYLAISLPPVELVYVTRLEDRRRLAEWDDDSRLEKMLGIFSSHPALHTLRILNNPLAKFGNNSDDDSFTTLGYSIETTVDTFGTVRGSLMHNFASQVMSFMTRHGSNIRVFSVSPSVMPDCIYVDGHMWPEYNYEYIKGRITDAMGQETVVAVPLKRGQLEMPQNKALLYNARSEPWE
jgi:hypothetical protein